MHVDDFSDYESWGNGIGDPGVGKPARGTWRSQDLSPQERLPIEVIRSTRVEEMTDRSDWLAESTAEGFVAYMDKCTHFCCVPGFKDTEQAKKFGASNRIFCVCHQSVYDPYSIVRRSFVALPRPEGGAGGGGEGGEDGGN
jgi:Rieske Fe-S protein